MNKKTKLVLHISLLILIFLLIILSQRLFFSWESAYRHMEKNIFHYGPADEIYVMDDSNGKYLLTKYDQWIVSFYVYHRYSIFYQPGFMVGQPLEIDDDDMITYGVSSVYFDGREHLVYAHASDPITTLEVDLSDGTTATLNTLSDHLHYGHWPSGWPEEDHDYLEAVMIRGYDEAGELIHEEVID